MLHFKGMSHPDGEFGDHKAMSNMKFPRLTTPLYYNQSADLSNRTCTRGEVTLDNGTQLVIWSVSRRWTTPPLPAANSST